jgi:hypothetical protein
MPKEGQLHPTFPAYQRWVISRLAGIFAADDTNVVPQIVMRWIDQNQEYLRQYGITYQEWQRLQAPRGVVRTPVPLKEERKAPGEEGKGEVLPNGSNPGRT